MTTTLAVLTMANAATAQTFNGNDVTSGPFSSGIQQFSDSALFDANTANAASGSNSQFYYDSSRLNASVADAISGGNQAFFNNSELNASAARAINGGTQFFLSSSSLNASEANAVSDGIQQFEDSASLYATAADAVSGGVQWFHENSALNASAADAVSGGTQNFYGNSALNASAADSVSGGTQIFHGSSALNASAANAVSGGMQSFDANSDLNASAADAVIGGIQRFDGDASLNAIVADAVSGGAQYFFNDSALNASAAGSISGGEQSFLDDSTLNASAAGAISGGLQDFDNSTVLNASAAGAISGGVQRFHNISALNASAAGAISGGSQEFSSTSALNASVANAVDGGTQSFFGNSTLNASAAGAISRAQIELFDSATVQVQTTGALTNGVAVNFNSGGAMELDGVSTTIGQISGSGNIRNTGATNATLTVDTSVLGDATFAGIIEGGGAGTLSLVKTGAGSLTLTGSTHSYTGLTVVNGGELIVNGSLTTSTFSVGSGGTLGGSGTVGTTTIASGGRVSPGNSIGTLNVAGNFTFDPGSIYEVEVDPVGAASDLITVSGTAFLNGSVLHIGPNGAYRPSATYTILTAGTISGRFAADADSTLAFLDATLAYGINDVTLTLTRNATGFADVASTRNQRAAAGGAEALGTGNAVYDAITGLDAAGARTAFDALSGEIHASAKTALIEDSRFVRNAALDRVRGAFDGGVSPTVAYGSSFSGWGQVFGSWGDSNSDGNAAGLQRQTGGVLAGFDGVVLDGWRLGVITGYSRSDFNAGRRASSGDSDNAHLGLYGGTQWGNIGLRAGAAHSWHDIETTRMSAFPGFSDRLTSEYDGGTGQVFGELGYRIDGPVTFEPFAGLAYVNHYTDGYSEDGGAAALVSSSSDTGVTFSTLGLRGSANFLLGGFDASVRGLIGWRHAFGDVTPLASHAFASGGDLLTVAGVPLAQDSAIIEAGIDLGLAGNASLNLSYSGQLASDAQDHGVKAGLLVRF